MHRLLALAATLLVVVGCSFEPAAAVLTVTAVGEPSLHPIGGYRLETQLVTDGALDGAWVPGPERTISTGSGRHEVVLRMIPMSDAVLCIDAIVPGEGGCKREEGPPMEICRMTVDLAPGSETDLPIALDSGPECRLVAA